MYAEGETELRDIIIQNLENSGFLNKIKAELRAGVFIAFEEEGSLRTKIPLFNKKFDEFVDTSNGKLAVSLVREFLEFFNLNFTLSVFDPEIATSSPCLNRTELCDKLNLKSSELKGPVLSALLNNKLTSTGKELKPSTEGLILQSNTTGSLNSKKSLETITEDSPPKEKVELDAIISKDVTQTAFSATASISLKEQPIHETPSTNLKPDAPKKSGSEMIDKLRNEHHAFESEKESNDIFGADKSDSSIFKVKTNTSLDLDPFFDEPVPSEQPSYFADSNLASQLKPNETLSSLKDLPALTTSKSTEWSFSREIPKTDSDKKGIKNKNEVDLESNEESSERQMNSEESIEEEIEEDFSGGFDDLLNSSLSLADDATTDQSASQISVVDGVDHIEPVNN